MTRTVLGLGIGVLVVAVGACSAGRRSTFGSDVAVEADEGAGGEGPEWSPVTGAGGGSGEFCFAQPNEDKDGDGFTISQGDCNDCDPNVNPGAIEVPTDPMQPDIQPADENCNNAIDEVAETCDEGIDLHDFDPMNGARALELCKVAAGPTDWGVTGALYVRANGTPLAEGTSMQVGVLDSFGPNVVPRNGSRILGLSSGRARVPGHSDACNGISCSERGTGQAPLGFPQDGQDCFGGSAINDDVGLEVSLRAPTNATGFSYEFSFYSHEYPEWVCTTFNDQYVAIVQPAPVGAINGNISFDSDSNPVSVNIALFEVCQGCLLGTNEMVGTGFDTWGSSGMADAGATGWLVTTAPVEGGSEIKVRFAIWDTGDTAFDSTVILDNFQWIASGGSVNLGTIPVPN